MNQFIDELTNENLIKNTEDLRIYSNIIDNEEVNYGTNNCYYDVS